MTRATVRTSITTSAGDIISSSASKKVLLARASYGLYEKTERWAQAARNISRHTSMACPPRMHNSEKVGSWSSRSWSFIVSLQIVTTADLDQGGIPDLHRKNHREQTRPRSKLTCH